MTGLIARLAAVLARLGFRPKVEKDVAPAYSAEIKSAFEFAHASRFKEAEAICRRAVEHFPGDAAALDALGVIFLAQRRYEEAEETFRRAIAIDPDQLIYLKHLSRALSGLDRDAEIVPHIEAFVRRHPHMPAAHLVLATAYTLSMDGAAAMPVAQKALKLDPANVQSYIAFSNICCQLGDTHGAISAIRSAAKIDIAATYREMGIELAEMLCSLNQRAAGFEAAERTFAIAAGQGLSVAAGKANFFDRHGKRRDGAALLQDAVRSQPDNARYWAHLGRLMANDDHVAAIRCINKALSIAPKDVLARAYKRSLERATKEYLPMLRRQAGLPPQSGKRAVGKTVIVVRGALDPSFYDVMKHFRVAFADTFIILSTWNDVGQDLLDMVGPYVDDLVLCSRPPTPGSSNINFQITNVVKGLDRARELGAERVLIARTDVALLQPDLLNMLERTLNEDEAPVARQHGLKGRLIISTMFTVLRPMYHVSDLFVFGYLDDVAKFWSADHMTDSCWRPEVLLARGLAQKIGRALRETEADALLFLREFFIVRDSAWFGTYWVKNPCLNSADYIPAEMKAVTEKIWRGLEK